MVQLIQPSVSQSAENNSPALLTTSPQHQTINSTLVVDTAATTTHESSSTLTSFNLPTASTQNTAPSIINDNHNNHHNNHHNHHHNSITDNTVIIPSPSPSSHLNNSETTTFITSQLQHNTNTFPLDNDNTNTLSSKNYSIISEDNNVNNTNALTNQTPQNSAMLLSTPYDISGSEESINTVDSLDDDSSSCQMFTSEYTDTITSNSSSAFLIKQAASDSSLENCPEDTMIGSYHCNDGYMSYSSTEMLNDSDDGGADESSNLINLDSTSNLDDTADDVLPIQNKDKEEEEEKEKLLESESESEPMVPTASLKHDLLYVEIQDETDMDSLSPGTPRRMSADVYQPSLLTINEDEIVSFVVEEIEPTGRYGKITDNIIVADESFLFNSELELANERTRANTMLNIHERSSFVDLHEDISKVGRVCQRALVYLKDDITLGSLASLNTALARENNKDNSQSISLITDDSKKNNEGILKKPNYLKNLLALSFTITLLYTAVGSVRNLQSSINHEGGVGVIGLAANFFGYVVGSLFSSSAIQLFQPRKTLIVSLFPNVLYVAANFYPKMWIMVPISLIQGISLAIIANASSTYITFLAKGCAEKKKQSFSDVSCQFFGLYSLMYISHLVIGNLVASVILQPPSAIPVVLGNVSENSTAAMLFNNATNNNSTLLSAIFQEDEGNLTMLNNGIDNTSSKSHIQFCGPNFCHHFDIGGSAFSVSMDKKIMLFSVYIGCIVLALLTAVLFMEPLNPNLFVTTVSPLKKLRTQMVSLLKFFLDVKFILLLPLLMHSTMHFAFLSAEFVKGYITCPIGIHMIGYTMICFGICSSISSYFCGLMNRYIGRIPFIVTASIPFLPTPSQHTKRSLLLRCEVKQLP